MTASTARKAEADLPRPYKCPICNKAFYRLEHQTRHIRTHTGEKPHVCTFPGCVKRFSRSDELTRHSRIHTNQNSRRDQRKSKHSPPGQSHAVPSTGISMSAPQGVPAMVSSTSATPATSTSGSPVASPGGYVPQITTAAGLSAPTSPQLHQQQLWTTGGLVKGPVNGTAPNFGAQQQEMSRSAFDIHALATAATQELERERAAFHTAPTGTTASSGVSSGTHTPSSSAAQRGSLYRQWSTPSLVQHFHSGPYDRPPARMAPLSSLTMSLRKNEGSHVDLAAFRKSHPGSPAASVPNSPHVSRPSTPSPTDTPLATPAHSPHLRPSDSDVQLPAIRTLPRGRYGTDVNAHAQILSHGLQSGLVGGTSNSRPNGPPFQPLEPSLGQFSGIRSTLDLPRMALGSTPSTPLTRSPAPSRPTSPIPRVTVSDLVNH